MQEFYSHPTALIDEGAKIGSGTKVWHFSHVMPMAVIGKNCSLGQNVFVANKVEIGNEVKIQNNVSLYEGVIVEDFVFLGPSMVFTNVVNPRSEISRKEEYKQTVIRKGASIGANATILCGNEIGRYAFIGAGSVVTKDVAAYALMVGNPAKQIGWMSQHGHRLELDENNYATCPATGQMYHLKNEKLEEVNDYA